MNKINGITKQIENALLKCRSISDEEFIQLLQNIEILKIHIIQSRKRLKNIKVYESENNNFYHFVDI